jgi:hypothetical protein
MKFASPCLRIFPFQGFPQSPFSSVYGPPGSYFGGGVPKNALRSPLARILPSAFQREVSPCASLFPGSPGGGSFLSPTELKFD